MASPQKENGHTDIANEILEAMAKTHWSGYEIQIVLYLLRKTYGWHKKEDWISLSSFSKATGIDHTSVCRTIKKLIKRNILIKINGKLQFNKNYDDWGGVAKSPLAKSPIRVVAKSPPTKETITKERIQDSSFKSKFNQKAWIDRLRHWDGERRFGQPFIIKEDKTEWCVRYDLKSKKVIWTSYLEAKEQYKLKHQKNGL